MKNGKNTNMINAVDIKMEPYRRPVISMMGTTVLIDTGATIPMFYFPVKLLEKAFGGIELIYEKAHVGGIGNGSVDGKIYALKRFTLDKLSYNNLHVFVPNEFYQIGENGVKIFEKHPMLLSATMFEGLDYEFDTISERFLVRSPIDIGLDMDFKIIKANNDQLVPVVNGVFIQESITTQNQILESYRQTNVEEITENILGFDAVIDSIFNNIDDTILLKDEDFER